MNHNQTRLMPDGHLIKPPDYRHVPFSERLSHFTWSWFEVTMSTGAIATLLSQQPFTFSGLWAIGKIFFILDLVLFVLFIGCITYRFYRTPSRFRSSLHHPHEGFFFGTFWVSLSLILYCAQQYGVQSCGPWLITALKVCFWIFAACAFLVAVFQYHALFDKERLPVITHAMPAILLIMYPFLTLGPLAAVLEYSQPQDPGMAIFIGGLLFQGLGWMFAFMIYTIYLTRLINSDLPPEPKRPGMFVAVGPSAYTAYTLVVLGSNAPRIVPDHYLGITSFIVGDVWKAIGVPAGIFIWLLGFWFAALATVSVLVGYKKMHFTLNYWAFIFPNAGLVIAAIQIGNVLDSTGIKAVCSGASIILVAVWLLVAVLTVWAVYKKQILWPGMDEDMEDMEGNEEDASPEMLEDV